MPEKKNKSYLLQDYKGRDFSVTDEILEKAVGYMNDFHRDRLLNPLSMGRKGSCTYLGTLKSLRHENRKLRPRQLSDIGHGLRKAILRQNWNEAAYLAQFLSSAGISRYSSVIIRTCFYLLLHHPNSSPELLENFIRKCTGYVQPEDIRKFIKILFALREEPLLLIENGKFARKNVFYKIVDDLFFKNL